MDKRQHKLIFLDPSPNKPSQFIFDQLYKNAADKNRFSKDRKFTYFNAIIKMKSKLAQQNNKFEYQNSKNQSNNQKNTSNQQSNIFSETQPLNFYKKQKQSHQQYQDQQKNFSLTKVNFKFDHKRRNSNYHSQKPRLDDILAQYRRIDKTSRLKQTKSASLNTKKKTNPIDIFKINGGLLPKCLPKKNKRQSSFL